METTANLEGGRAADPPVVKNRVGQIIDERHLKDSEFARIVGVTRLAVHMLRYQKNMPGRKLLARICDEFNLDVGDVIYLDKSDRTCSVNARPVGDSGKRCVS
jgi:DNA-binding Xre family transcriptional regulator